MANVLPFPVLIEPPPTSPPDQRERELALDIQRSWIVEAPAGSGKTGLLIQRYLKLLADESVSDPGQVLAITFTNKATSEMQERVLRVLRRAEENVAPRNDLERAERDLADGVLERDRRLGWELLRNPHRIAIQTIHGLCASIVSSLPVLSGASGSGMISERGAELYAEAARRTLLLLGGPDPELNRAIEILMLHRDGSLKDCERLLAEMLGWRDQWGRLVPIDRGSLNDAELDAEVLPRLEGALREVVCAALTRTAERMPQDVLAQLAELASEMSYLEGYRGAPSPIAICAELRDAPGTAAADLNHWQILAKLLVTPSQQGWRGGFNNNHIGFEITRSHRAQLKALVERVKHDEPLCGMLCRLLDLPPTSYPEDQWTVAKALFRVLTRALVELQIVFAERGEMDFTEVSLLAEAALRHEEARDGLRVSNGLELRHLLVDEMQDTSTSQYELIQRLTESWDGHSQTVFLVGDPKQSIYLFRQARVEQFVRTMRTGRLGEIRVGCLHLTANFRTQKALVTAFNRDFAAIFPANHGRDEPDAVPYVEAAAMRPAAHYHIGHWHGNALPYASDKEDASEIKRWRRREDAREIAEIITRWQVTPLPANRTEPWKIAVLVRSRIHLQEIVTRLREACIAFRAVKIDPLGERQEILDLLALTRSLLHPADRVAWLALLRAPWCGLTLADLHRLSGADDPQFAEWSVPRLMEERGHEMSDDGCTRLARVWIVMQNAMRQRGTLSASAWIEQTWRALGGAAIADEEARTNVRQYLRLVDEAEEPDGTVDLAKLTARIDDLYAEPSQASDAVDLMTIHKAKGLEWDVVIVPSLERTGKASQRRLLSWVEWMGEGGEPRFALAPIERKGGPNATLNDWIAAIDKQRDAAELKRLFYVVATRAREELHLFAAPAINKAGKWNPRTDTLLKGAEAAARPHFEEAPQPALEDLDWTADAGFAIAAGAENRSMIERIPFRILGPVNVEATTAAPAAKAHRSFDRPQGSFESRAFGNTVHALLDLLTGELARGASAEALLAQVPGWTNRIAAMLRSNGVAPVSINPATRRVVATLESALRDPLGLWLLGPRRDAANELALVAIDDQDHRTTVRLDRTFLAGDVPIAKGEDVRWIIDYKTSTHGTEGVEAFLASERQTYAPQLEAYARQMGDGLPVHVGLYYPRLARFIWWKPE